MILLTGYNCAPCKAVKKYIESSGLKDQINYVDVTSPDGMALRLKHGIRSVPVLVATDGVIVGGLPIMKVLIELAKEVYLGTFD